MWDVKIDIMAGLYWIAVDCAGVPCFVATEYILYES